MLVQKQAKGYVTEEVIEFCVDYVDYLCPIGVPVSRHEWRLIGKGTLGRKSVNASDHATLSKAHLTVLQLSAFGGSVHGEEQANGAKQVPFEV